MPNNSNAIAEPYSPGSIMVPSATSGGLFDNGDTANSIIAGAIVQGAVNDRLANLTESEGQRLVVLEGTIHSGLGVFYEVGNALSEIRESRLYRQTHGTFEEYCRTKWGMTRQHANRMISAAEVITELEPSGSTPTSEAVARPLARLNPEQRKEAWELAQKWAGVGAVTAAIVEQAAEEICPREAKVQRVPEEPHPELFPNEVVSPAGEVVQALTPEQEIAEEENIDEIQTEVVSATEPEEETPSSETKTSSAPVQPPAPPKPAPAPTPKPAVTTSPTSAPPVATATPKAPEGFISTFVPEADCFFLQDEGLTMQGIFSTMRELVELGQPIGLSPEDLMTTLRSALGLDDIEVEAS